MDVYFDNAATTLVREEVIELIGDVMRSDYGNPSSTHDKGRRAAGVLEKARQKIAFALAAKPEEIYFTSGGTEADNWAISACVQMRGKRGRHIITSATEHAAVLEPIKLLERSGWEISYLLADEQGCIGAKAFAEALREDTAFASIMLVNNETGAVNPIAEYSKEIKRRKLGTILHCDAVQAFCKLPATVSALGAQLVSVSAHKLHGPKGVGALYVKDGTNLSALFLGGSQEKGKRAGTQALPAIAGFGEAARLALEEREFSTAAVQKLRDMIVDGLADMLPEAVIISKGGSPYILSISLPGYKSEVLMNFLDSEGISVSKGAACKKNERSHVLEAMRLKNEIIDGALRISFSKYNTAEEADYFLNKLKKASEVLVRIRN